MGTSRGFAESAWPCQPSRVSPASRETRYPARRERHALGLPIERRGIWQAAEFAYPFEVAAIRGNLWSIRFFSMDSSNFSTDTCHSTTV